MPRLLAAFLLALAVSIPARAAPGVTLELITNEYGVFFIVAADAPHQVYIQVDPEGGAHLQSPTFYTPTLGAGELFGGRIEAYGLGSVRVRVWTNTGNAPDADATYRLPTYRTYLALL
jgi:hypothetical protein